ncbi:MAG: hypothetical protein ACOY4R_22400 [Pseudomonadota bacterium]
MKPDTSIEWALIFNAFPTTALALLILALPPIDRLATQVLASVLEAVCATSIPTFWCRIPVPPPFLAVVHVVDYVAFLFVSAYFVFKVGFATYVKPVNYAPGTLPVYYQLGALCFWLFMAAGGQVFPLRTPPLSYLGLLFAALALSVGVACIRGLMISLRYPKGTAERTTLSGGRDA